MPIISYRELRDAGQARRDVESVLRTTDARRVRIGWYATPDTPAEVIAAVRCGGSLSCRAALRHHGVWTIRGPAHARLAPKARRHDHAIPTHRSVGNSVAGIDDLPTALRVAMHCLSKEEAVCAIDSVLNHGFMSRGELEDALQTPQGRRALGAADGRSESGLETLGRLRLRALGLKVRIQVPIAGVGRVDLIVGDRLVIEFDGDLWHSTPDQREADRRRDSALVARGYVIMRVGYARVLGDWDGFAREVLAVVRRRGHRFRLHDVG